MGLGLADGLVDFTSGSGVVWFSGFERGGSVSLGVKSADDVVDLGGNIGEFFELFDAFELRLDFSSEKVAFCVAEAVAIVDGVGCNNGLPDSVESGSEVFGGSEVVGVVNMFEQCFEVCELVAKSNGKAKSRRTVGRNGHLARRVAVESG